MRDAALKRRMAIEAYWRDPEKFRRRSAEWSAAHPDQIRAARRTPRAIESRKEIYKRWREKHSVEHRQRNREYRSRVRLAGPRMSTADWQALIKSFDHRCAYCNRVDVEITMDHVIPLRHGGTNDGWNILPACRSCNSRKKTMTAVEYIAVVERVGS